MSEEQPADVEEQDIDWMLAEEAQEYLRHRGAAPWVGEPEVVYKRLAARLIRTRAEKVWRGRGAKKELVNDGQPLMLKPEIWEQMVSARIGWHDSTFSGISRHLRDRLSLQGLSFAREDIEAIVAPEAILTGDALQAHINKSLDGSGEHTGAMIDVTPTPGAAPKSRRGRPPKETWPEFWFAAMQLAEEQRLNKAHFKSKDALLEEIQLMLPPGSFHDDTLKGAVHQIWERFVAPKGG